MTLRTQVTGPSLSPLQPKPRSWLAPPCAMLSLPVLLASHGRVAPIEELCSRELPTITPQLRASFCSPFNRPQRKILIAGLDNPSNLCSPGFFFFFKFPCISSFSFFLFVCSSRALCHLQTVCNMCCVCVHTLQEEKYVVSELILFLTYREIPVVFNLDCGIRELYREEK